MSWSDILLHILVGCGGVGFAIAGLSMVWFGISRMRDDDLTSGLDSDFAGCGSCICLVMAWIMIPAFWQIYWVQS